MSNWYLGAGDPLAFTLAADFRLGETDYLNDQIWELEPGRGDPPALALQTTYGLRARSMRLFPRFTTSHGSITHPDDFAAAPRLRVFYPNFMQLSFSPITGIEIAAEYWVPNSQSIACRLTFTNHSLEPAAMALELCGLLIPLDGESLAPVQMQSVHVLAGQTANLKPVIFLTGGAQPGLGPYPSLMLDINLAPGASRQLTWAHSALNDVMHSFELARRTAARAWDAERARIELLNASQSIEINTGNPDWDAAFALSQKSAFSLFFPASAHLPAPSFVLSRQPDQGFSPTGDGSDHPLLWSGQSPLEAYYLSSLIPGAPQIAEGLLHNFLSTAGEDGNIDCRPGLSGQRGRCLGAPLLATLAWKIFEANQDINFLEDTFPGLLAFFRAWFLPAHDRDGDGFPEWDHPLQTGFEDNPAFTAWHESSQGGDISLVETPALSSLLFSECLALIRMAEHLGKSQEIAALHNQAEVLRKATEACWNSRAALYRIRDRDTHHSASGRVLARRHGQGKIQLRQSFKQPTHLLIRLQSSEPSARQIRVSIHGYKSRRSQSEELGGASFQWGTALGAAVSRECYTRLGKIETKGIQPHDRVTVSTLDFTGEDHTLFLALWAGIPNPRRAKSIVQRNLSLGRRFYKPFGIPACIEKAGSQRLSTPAAVSICQTVHIPWNHLIGEGLLGYGLRGEAAELITRIMAAVIENLKKRQAFYRAYDGENGAGMGERNILHGLAPVGLFLQTLGVQFIAPDRVRLSGKNPFPWPVTVKYRGLAVTRQAEQTEVLFPDGRSLLLHDPTDAIISPA